MIKGKYVQVTNPLFEDRTSSRFSAYRLKVGKVVYCMGDVLGILFPESICKVMFHKNEVTVLPEEEQILWEFKNK